MITDAKRYSLDQNKILTEVLMKEYDNRFAEVLFHSGRYHKQVNFIQLYLTVLGSSLAIIFSRDWSLLTNSLPDSELTTIKAGIITAAFLVSLYLFSNVMDALYAIYMNGKRIASIEKKINNIFGEEILTWDSQIVPRLYSMDKFFIGLWVRPNMILGAWSFTFFIGVTVSLCVIAFYIANSYFYYFAPLSMFTCIYLVINWLLLHTTGLDFIESAVENKSFKTSRKYLALILFFGNFLLAYVPMVLFSIRNKTLFFGSVTFPFCSLPSVYFGDLVIIPIFNYYLFKWFLDSYQAVRWKGFVIGASGVASIIAASTLHWSWIHDPWSGFMDDFHGKLSAAGIVHYGYSIIQYFFVAALIGLVLANWKRRDINGINITGNRDVKSAMSSIVAFSSLSLVDWCVRNFSIINRSFIESIKSDFLSLTPFIISVIIFPVMIKLNCDNDAERNDGLKGVETKNA